MKTIQKFYLFMFLKDFAFFSAVLVPFYTEWAHISLFQVQLLQSWFMLCLFVLDVPMGVVADHIGKKYVLLLGVFIDAIGCLLYGSFSQFGIFLLGEFLMALAMSLISGADNALLYGVLEEEGEEGKIKQVTSRSQAVNLLGIFLAAPLGSLIASHFGLNVPMLATAIPLLVAAVVAWTIHEPKVTQKLKRVNPLQTAKEGIRFFYSHPKLRVLAMDGIIVASSTYFVVWLYQPLLQQSHVPIAVFGFITPILVGSELAVTHFFPHIEKLLGSSKRYLLLSAAVTAGAFFLVGLVPTIATIVLFLVFAGGFGYTRMDLMTSYMSPFIPSDKRATVLSTISMTRRFWLVLLNPVVGFLADFSLHGVLLMLGLLPLAMVFFSPVEHSVFEEIKQSEPAL